MAGIPTRRERQCLRCVKGRRREGFAVNETMQQVQHMRLGRDAGLQRHVDGREHCLFVVLENKCRISTISRSSPGYWPPEDTSAGLLSTIARLKQRHNHLAIGFDATIDFVKGDFLL